MSGRGRHRRPSARPAAIVTLGAGALLLAAAVPAGSVEDATSGGIPMPSFDAGASDIGMAPAQGGDVGDALELVDVLLQRLSSDPGSALDEFKAGLADLRRQADAKQLAGQATEQVRRLAELNAGALEILVKETLREIQTDVVGTLAALKDGFGDLRDGLARKGGPNLDVQALYGQVIQLLGGVVNPALHAWPVP